MAITLWQRAKRSLPRRVQRFLSWPGTDRLHTWTGDVNLIGLGAALAALVWGFTVPEAPSRSDAPLVLFFGVAAGIFLVAGFLAKTPTAQIDERWDDRYDQLRDQTEEIKPVLSSSFISSIWQSSHRSGEPSLENWEEYVPRIPIPIPDERPLHEWDYFLETHPLHDVRQFFKFAKAAGGLIGVSNYRRFAVRTYHRFGRLLNAEADGFEPWFMDEGVKDGAEPIVVLLAYLEVARAVQYPTEFRGDGHGGFWSLAAKWHPATITLPRPTPLRPLGHNSATI